MKVRRGGISVPGASTRRTSCQPPGPRKDVRFMSSFLHGFYSTSPSPAAGAVLAVHRAMQFDTPLVRQVIGCGIEVHSLLGPGLLESAYERCLAYELQTHGIAFNRQVPVPVVYRDLDCSSHIAST